MRARGRDIFFRSSFVGKSRGVVLVEYVLIAALLMGIFIVIGLKLREAARSRALKAQGASTVSAPCESFDNLGGGSSVGLRGEECY